MPVNLRFIVSQDELQSRRVRLCVGPIDWLKLVTDNCMCTGPRGHYGPKGTGTFVIDLDNNNIEVAYDPIEATTKL